MVHTKLKHVSISFSFLKPDELRKNSQAQAGEPSSSGGSHFHRSNKRRDLGLPPKPTSNPKHSTPLAECSTDRHRNYSAGSALCEKRTMYATDAVLRQRLGPGLRLYSDSGNDDSMSSLCGPTHDSALPDRNGRYL